MVIRLVRALVRYGWLTGELWVYEHVPWLPGQLVAFGVGAAWWRLTCVLGWAEWSWGWVGVSYAASVALSRLFDRVRRVVRRRRGLGSRS